MWSVDYWTRRSYFERFEQDKEIRFWVVILISYSYLDKFAIQPLFKSTS